MRNVKNILALFVCVVFVAGCSKIQFVADDNAHVEGNKFYPCKNPPVSGVNRERICKR